MISFVAPPFIKFNTEEDPDAEDADDEERAGETIVFEDDDGNIASFGEIPVSSKKDDPRVLMKEMTLNFVLRYCESAFSHSNFTRGFVVAMLFWIC